MAKVTEDYFDSSARKAETVLEWKRQSIQLGLDERRTGIVCVDNILDSVEAAAYWAANMTWKEIAQECTSG